MSSAPVKYREEPELIMGLLGDESGNDREKMLEQQLRQMNSQLDDISSRVNALDNALDDFQGRLTRLERQSEEQEGEKEDQEFRALYGNNKERIREMREEVTEIGEQVEEMSEMQQSRMNDMEDISRQLYEAVTGLKSMVKKSRKHDRQRRKEIEKLRDRLDSLETDYTVEKNQNEYDIERKLDENRFKNRKKEIDNELGKLRTSINALAQAMDREEEIEIED